jgi:hypothetical protein
LCTLARYSKQDPALLPERVVFIVISDEDDTASQTGCLQSFRYAQVPSTRYEQDYGCTQDCAGYRFTLTQRIARTDLVFECVPTDDLGGLDPTGAVSGTVFAFESDSCEQGPSQPCNSAQQARARIDCQEGYSLQNCNAVCDEEGLTRVCSHVVTDDSIELCGGESLTWADMSYESLTALCTDRYGSAAGWGGCEKDGYFTSDPVVELSRSQGAAAVYDHIDTLQMVRLFQLQAERAFGSQNFFVESIVFDPAFECVPEAGQSHATDLRNVSTSPAHVYPICESYAPALDRVDQFAKSLLQTQYPLVLGMNEAIVGVTVQSRDGSTRQLSTRDYDYDDTTQLLSLDEAALSSADLGLSIEVEDPCVPTAR